MPQPKKKTRKRTLFEKEHGRIPQLSAKEASEFEELERLGIAQGARSNNPADFIWTGGKREIDVYDIFRNGLGPRTALEQVLAAIIDAHPVRKGLFGDRAGAELKTYRINQALKALIGAEPKRGVPKPDYEPFLERVAVRYYNAYRGLNLKTTALEKILWEEARPADYEISFAKDPVKKSNFLKPYKREWELHRDRLLVKVSGGDLPQADLQAQLIRAALASLVALGVSVNHSEQ